MWEEVYPNLKCEVPQWRGALHDSENGFLSRFGIEMVCKGWSFVGASMVRKKKGIATWEREWEKLLNFFWGWVSEQRENVAFYFKKASSFFFLKAMPYVSFWVEQKGPTFSLDVTHTQPQEEKKIWPFEMLKSCLGLHAAFLVPVPRVSLHPSRPVFESKQYIYQNAQNETPSVVQRLVLLNFKLHAKR